MDQFKSILTKYWIAILCGVVALAAVIASYVPLNSYHDDLHAKMQKRAGAYDTASGLIHKPRQKPLQPGQVTPDPLTNFPSPSLIKSGQDARDKINTESLTAYKVVADANVHQQLVPGLLPNSATVGVIEYRNAYTTRLAANGLIYKDILNAGTPPTAQDIKDASDKLWKTDYEPNLSPDPANPGKAFNQESLTAQFNQAVAALPGTMRTDLATHRKVYAPVEILPVDPIVAAKGGILLDPPKIWWSQLQLWVTEDVAKSIADANSQAANVTNAPIKRLVKLDIPGGNQAMLFNGSRVIPMAAPPPPSAPGADPAAAGTPMTADSTTPVPTDVKSSPSGRVCCNMYDVVQFHLDLVVSAKDLPAVLESFARMRLMSVLSIDSVQAEDTAQATADGYIYGADPVVRVSLKCETLFLREWTIPLMPERVKHSLATNAPATPDMSN